MQKRLQRPLSSISAIRQVQGTVRFLASVIPEVTFPFSQIDLDYLQGYLDSNFILLKSAEGLCETIKEKWFSLRNPEFTHFVRKEPWTVLEFLRKAGALYDRLDSETCPEQLREDIHFFRAVATYPGIREWLQDSGGGEGKIHDGIQLDYLFRKELKEIFLRILERLADLDGLLSMAKVVNELGLVMPEFVEKKGPMIQICGVSHPFVDKPVLNDFEAQEGNSVLFLTGPNMAGKTTYIKAVTICLLLAHAGMGVPARGMRLTWFSRIFCSLNAVDDIREGVSSFFSEIRRVKQVLQAMQEDGHVFAVFDELFKGTNVKDAVDCSNVVINGLAGNSRHASIVSSHLLELHELLADSRGIDYFHFNGETREGKTKFDYRLKPGVNGQRLGFQILQEEGILRLLENSRQPTDFNT